MTWHSWRAILAAMFVAQGQLACAASLPNFVVILADDLGYGDLGCYGAEAIRTPRIDRMAAEGARFTAAYSAAPFCSPSRAALLTGRMPARCGLPYVLFPAEHHGLPAEETTLAELLRDRGYATACIGKWHLGWDAEFRPQRQGFDVFYGVPYSNDSNEWPVGEPFLQIMGFQPFSLFDGDRVIEAPADQSRLTQRYTAAAVQFIREHRDRPFLLYLPHTMPHVPQYASAEFEGRSPGGLYGDAVEELDWSTGEILDVLQELHLADDTLVIFTSDNGASVRRNSPADRPNAPAIKERFPGRTLGGSNGPLRGSKGQTWEGGVRVPCLAWRPGWIPAGRELDAPISLLDLFPTMAALSGTALPDDRTYDGRDIAPLLNGSGDLGQRPIYHYFGYQLQAVRDGNWKLLLAVASRPDPRPASLWWDHQPRLFETQHRLQAQAELYDLARDPGETTDVAANHPDVVARMTTAAQRFDADLQRDLRPIQFVDGPAPPPPGTVRTPDLDLSSWRNEPAHPRSR